MTIPHLFCFGLGYSGQALARTLLAMGWRVSGTCRSVGKAASLGEQGINAFIFDGEQAFDDAASRMAGVTHILSSIPPDTLDPVLGNRRADIETAACNLQWLGYLSTIGVYGDCKGAWIDETTPVAPLSIGGRQRVDAENQWIEFGGRIGVPTRLFRLPGIYGPGARSQIDALRTGRARRIVKDAQVFNRIHVDDLVAVLVASMTRPNTGAGRIYNVCDHEPAPAHDVVTFAAQLLGIEPPQIVMFKDAKLSPFAAHFYGECKRVRNQRITHELGVTLQYPTYREGLRAIAEMRL